MTTRSRTGRVPLALALGLMVALPGCYGSSEDKGDNGGSIITPKPSKVEDANTAGDRKSVLPVPDKSGPKPDSPAVGPPS